MKKLIVTFGMFLCCLIASAQPTPTDGSKPPMPGKPLPPNTVRRPQPPKGTGPGAAQRADKPVRMGDQGMPQIGGGVNIVPQPRMFMPKEGAFMVTPAVKIYVSFKQKELKAVAELLSVRFRNLQGFVLELADLDTASVRSERANSITFDMQPSKPMGPEAYTLSVTPNKVAIVSSSAAGGFYGLQSFLQLLPAEVYGELKLLRPAIWRVPCVLIEDEPRFSYRGMHLDVSRHFMPVEFIKKYIDVMAMHKMNTFHWHLTDDQGWRIEIKKYPRLTQVGSQRKNSVVGHPSSNPLDDEYDDHPHGGFYTQAEIKNIVQYAQSKFVTIIPEIEMPGHALAALAAYPEYGCTDGPFEVANTWGVFDDVFCPKEATFKFIEDVLTEVMEMFPSKVIHIGGDECPKTAWRKSKFCQDLIKSKGLKDEHELQSYFIGRVEKFVNSKGRNIIGWDEILEGGLAPNASVMSWRGTKGGIEAAMQNHYVVMTPTSDCYFDYYQSEPTGEPLAIGGYLPLEKVYAYEPVPSELSPEQAKYILGTQGNVWTEYLASPRDVEYMAYPRACALAEVAWSPKAGKNYDDFLKRLAVHFRRLDALGVNHANHLAEVRATLEKRGNGSLYVALKSASRGTQIFYTLDGSEPLSSSNVYTIPILITSTTNIKAASFEKGRKASKVTTQTFYVNKLTGLPYKLTTEPNGYTGGSPMALADGKMGSDERFDGWVGLTGGDLEATFNITGITGTATEVSINFGDFKNAWVHQPQYVTLGVSDDGVNFKEVSRFVPEVNIATTKQRITAKLPLNGATGKFIRVFAKNAGKIPVGFAGEGQPAWLFVDEIMMQ